MSSTTDTRPLTERIAQAVGDPGSIVGRRFGPSWGEGNDGYSEHEETVTRWSTRAVLAVVRETDFWQDGYNTGCSASHSIGCDAVEAERDYLRESTTPVIEAALAWRAMCDDADHDDPRGVEDRLAAAVDLFQKGRS